MNDTVKEITSLDLKPYGVYRETGVDWLEDIPAHWAIVPLAKTTKRAVNGIWGNEPYGQNDIVCIRVADFDRHRLRVSLDNLTFRAVTPRERRSRLLKRGDLLLEKSGGGELHPVGVTVLFNHDMEAVCSNFISKLSVSDGYEARWLTYLHSHLYVIGLNKRSIKQTTGIQNLDMNSYFAERIPLPPLGEQVAISRFLDGVDERVRRLVEAKERLVGLLEELKVSTISEAVTGQIDVCTGQPYPVYKPSHVDWLGAIPSHWEVVRGKSLWECVDVRSATGEEELLTVSSERGVLPRSTTSVTMFKAASYVGHKLCWPEDLVINSLWAWAGGLGFSEYHGIISSAYGVYRLRSSRQQDVRYLHELVRSGPFKYELRVRSKGVWTSRLQLTDTAFLNAYISLPPLAEQQAIAEYLSVSISKISTAIANTRREIDLLEEYRARMIADVVTGKVDVWEAIDHLEEPAA